MKIKDKLKTLCNYYNFTRKVGHTTLLRKGTDNFEEDKLILAYNKHCHTHLNQPPDNVVSLSNLNSLRDKRTPLVIDNDALSMILADSLNEIERLEAEIIKYKRALAVFTDIKDIDKPQQLNS